MHTLGGRSSKTPWKPPSITTVRKVDSKISGTTRKAQVQTVARANAARDVHVFGQLIAMMMAAKELGGAVAKCAREAVEGKDPEAALVSLVEERELVKGWTWNFDATAGKTFDYQAELKAVLGSVRQKVEQKNGLQ